MKKSNMHLDEILRLIFPSQEITWLSERSNTNIIIQWVCLDVLQGQEGDLLVIPHNEFNNKNKKIATRCGISAVLLIGKQPEVAKETASEIPILILDTQLSVRQVQREIMELISSRDNVLIEKKLYIHADLTKMVADGVGLEGLAQAMHEITRHGVMIHDKRLRIIADVSSPDLQTEWKEIKEKIQGFDNLPLPLRDRQAAGEQENLILQNISRGLSRLITPIIVGKVARGYLSVIGKEGALDILDRLVAEEGALICAIEMSRTKAVRETEKKLQSDLLTALLQEDLSPRDAKLWIDAIGFDRRQAHSALQFAWDSPDPPSRRRMETLINGEIARLGARAILNPAGEAVICFCQVARTEDGYLLAMELGEHVIEQARIEFLDIPLRCGIGSPAEDLNQWHISFREAGLALDMAVRLNEIKPVYYPDLSVYRLLLLLETNPELLTFLEDTLGNLLLHENKDEFIRTLEAFFEHKGNISQTAETLFIHRNTLSYRLKQIAELTKTDLKKYDSALAVQLALKIFRMLQGGQNR